MTDLNTEQRCRIYTSDRRYLQCSILGTQYQHSTIRAAQRMQRITTHAEQGNSCRTAKLHICRTAHLQNGTHSCKTARTAHACRTTHACRSAHARMQNCARTHARTQSGAAYATQCSACNTVQVHATQRSECNTVQCMQHIQHSAANATQRSECNTAQRMQHSAANAQRRNFAVFTGTVAIPRSTAQWHNDCATAQLRTCRRCWVHVSL